MIGSALSAEEGALFFVLFPRGSSLWEKKDEFGFSLMKIFLLWSKKPLYETQFR